MFGIIHKDLALCLALNHLVIIGKYFLYVNALSSKLYVFNEFVSLVSEKHQNKKNISFLPLVVKKNLKRNDLFFLLF